LSDALDDTKTKVSDALLIFVSCHAGGNGDMAVTGNLVSPAPHGPERLTATVCTPRGGEHCDTPGNPLARARSPVADWNAARSITFPKSNFTFIAAARESEVALDDETKGGLTTVGLLQCEGSGVPSSRGLVTTQDLANCAARQSRAGYAPVREATFASCFAWSWRRAGRAAVDTIVRRAGFAGATMFSQCGQVQCN